MVEVILFLWTKGFETYLGICVNANVCIFERTRESRLFCAPYMFCPGSAVSCNRPYCKRQSMRWVQNNWSTGTGLCLNARTQMYFPKQFWDVRNNKRSSDIDGKTSHQLCRDCLSSHYLELRFCY